MRDPVSKAEHYRELAVKYRELAKFAQPAYLGDFYRGIAVRYAFVAQELERAKKEVGFTPERRVRPQTQRQAEDVAIDVRKRREEVDGGPHQVRDGEVLVRIGLRSTSAVMGALAIGFTLGLVVKYGLADAGPRRVPARPSDLETASSASFDLQRPYGSRAQSASGMRLASLEMPVSGFRAENVDPPALAKHPGFFGDRLLLDERLGSFDERFGGAVVSLDAAPAKTAESESRRTPDVSHRWICVRKQRANLQSAGLGRSRPLHQRSSALRKKGFARQIFRRI